MGFGQAVSTVFSKYATFSGRARRSEYWWWILFSVLVAVVASIADVVLKTNTLEGSGGVKLGWIYVIASLALVIPTIAVTFRRLHDTGRSGWWWLLSLVCGIGAIIVLIFCLSDSKPGANEYGPNPKGA
ncbi:MAG: DUF805 domain-containing protein [Candidatus Nanopelagicales bacterium]